jgi:hypothetical protein
MYPFLEQYKKRAVELLRVRLAAALDRTALLPTNVIVEQVDFNIVQACKTACTVRYRWPTAFGWP